MPPVLCSPKEHTKLFQVPFYICHTQDCLPALFLKVVSLSDSSLLSAVSVFLPGYHLGWVIYQFL
jgi:hypothetical protein